MDMLSTTRLLSQRPTVDPAVRLVPLPDGRLQIRAPGERMTVGRHAPLISELLQLSDGTRRREEITTLLQERGHALRDVEASFDLLTQQHVLVCESTVRSQASDAAIREANHIGRKVRAAVGMASSEPSIHQVQVVGTGHLAAATRVELKQLGITRTDDEMQAHASAVLVIACSDYENHVALRDVNRRANDDGSPVLFACIAEGAARIGPFVVPGETACFECYHHRLRANAAYRDELDALLIQNAELDETETDSGCGLYARLGAALIAAQVINYLAGCHHLCVFERTVELRGLALELETHRILKLPRCTVCGLSEARAPRLAIRDWT